MNERIRELAEQAGLKYHNWITNESNVKDGDFRYPRLEDLENFAELIVKEVFAKIEDERFEVYQPVKEAVMKHFGIE